MKRPFWNIWNIWNTVPENALREPSNGVLLQFGKKVAIPHPTPGPRGS